MTLRMKLLALAATAGFACHAGSAAAAEFAVVVNADNPVVSEGEAAKETVRRIYLKEIGQWAGGIAAEPVVARTAGSPAQEAFAMQVLKMTPAELNVHWARLKQTRGETAPREVGSALILFRMLSRAPGGLAVLTEEELLDAPAEIAVLFRFSN